MANTSASRGSHAHPGMSSARSSSADLTKGGVRTVYPARKALAGGWSEETETERVGGSAAGEAGSGEESPPGLGPARPAREARCIAGVGGPPGSGGGREVTP